MVFNKKLLKDRMKLWGGLLAVLFLIIIGAGIFNQPVSLPKAEAQGSCNPPETGSWTINDVQVCENMTITVDEFIYINNGGELHLSNVTLNMDHPSTYQHVLRVEDGGKLYSTNGTTFTSSYTSSRHQSLAVYDGGEAYFSDSTTVGYPVYIRVRFYSGSTVEVIDSDFNYITYFHTTNAVIQNSYISNPYVLIYNGHEVEIDNLDHAITNLDYHITSNNGLSINVTNTHLHNLRFFNYGKLTVSNSNIYGIDQYNYTANQGTFISNTNLFLIGYYAYQSGTTATVEGWHQPLSSFSGSIISSNSGDLVLESSDVSRLYLYSSSSASMNIENSTVYFLYALGSSTNEYTDVAVTYRVYLYGNSTNRIVDSAINTSNAFYMYQTSSTELVNSSIDSGNLRLYNTASLTASEESSVSRLRLTADSPSISGFVNITSLSAWTEGVVLNREMPFKVTYLDGAPAAGQTVTIKDGETIIDEGNSDAEGWAKLTISADNSANPGKEYSVELNGEYQQNVTILEDTTPEGIVFSLSIYSPTPDPGGLNVLGWAWSSNIGWISFNNTDPGTETGYGLKIDPETLKLSGYIWSENIGWISFNKSEAGEPPSDDPCPEDPNCMAVLDEDTFEFSGWGRALNHGDGWSGWVRLSGTAADNSPYGVSVDPDTLIFEGWAWGGGVIGWISFNSENEVPGTPEYYVHTIMDIGPTVSGLNHEWDCCLNTLHPFLNWEVSKPSYGYAAEIYKDAEMKELVYQYESGTTGAVSHIPDYDAGTCHVDENGYQNIGICNLEYGNNQYWWRIKARSEAGLYGAWSDPDSFIVENEHHWPEPDYVYDPDPVKAKQVAQFIDQSTAYGNSSIEQWYWTISGTEGVDYDFVSAQRIPVADGLMLHLDAALISGLEDGGKISQWDDASGQGNHAVNADPATQPIFKENAATKKPAVGFAQTLDRSDPRHLDVNMSSDHSPGDGPSVFAVVLIPDNIADETRVGNVWGSYPATPDYNLELHTSGRTRWYWNSGERNLFGTADLRTGQLAVVSFHRDASNGRMQTYINGTLDLDNNDPGTNVVYSQDWRIGRDYRSGTGIALIGDITEFAVYERALSTSEREAVEQYLMDKWLTEGGIEETGPESQNPYIIFRLEGEYDVTLEVTDSSGYGPCAITKRINVEEAADLEWREVSPTE